MAHSFLLCSPSHYGISYAINPWMEENRHRPRPELAQRQWEMLRDTLRDFADVEELAPQAGLPDKVFVAGSALVLGRRAVAARFRHAERQAEEPAIRSFLADAGYEVIALPSHIHFEGASDAMPDAARRVVWMGYGFRTVLDAAAPLAAAFDAEIVPLHLIDPKYFTLSTCFCPLSHGHLLWYPEAFDQRSRRVVEERVPAGVRLELSERDASQLAASAIDTGRGVVMHCPQTRIVEVLRHWGYSVIEVDLSEFLLSGGGARDLALRLDQPEFPPASRPATPMLIPSAELEFTGHLIDTGSMDDILNSISREGGTFEIVKLEIGARDEDISRLRVRVSAPDAVSMNALLGALRAKGGTILTDQQDDARFLPADIDGVAPDGFHSTTIFPTEVCIEGRWHRATRQRMDGVLVLDPAARSVAVTLIRDLRRGDLVAVGDHGIRILPPQKPEEKEREAFSFMSAAASSERRVEGQIEEIAREMHGLRASGGRVVVVSGPVVVHTGGAPYLGQIIRAGFVQAFLGGNAVAVHDIESQLFGTSLGVNLRRGVGVTGGHSHHIRTINAIRRCGSIRAAVEMGVLQSGLMHEIIRAGIPFCLAGSIRDDGPLPDTQMDLIKAQAEHARILEGARMIIMLSSMLHSIGVGNMTPAGVRLVCVDINPAVATKLMDRGSIDSTPIVTDVGLFLNLLWRKLGELG